MDTIIYVDGFNLYYGSLRKTPGKWLDLSKLCGRLLPSNNIIAIKYFTAKVSARLDDPGQPTRQQAYLRALATLPQVEIYFGHFLSHDVYMPMVQSFGKNKQYAHVIKTEEKGSDVNLASHLLIDGPICAQMPYRRVRSAAFAAPRVLKYPPISLMPCG